MVDKLYKELAALPQVEAIALGGSRAGAVFDEKSDYDVYVYCTAEIADGVRNAILTKYCSCVELGNHYWELEDNCTLNNGIDIDILYRDLDGIVADVSSVVEQFNAHNGYTTCLWHNIKTCKIVFDRNGKLAEVKKRFDVPYPEELRQNIITRNMNLLHGVMPSYDGQIAKAAKRNDLVSINHRTAAFIESYFDVIFAYNRLTHTGEKRLVQLCKRDCESLPCDFEENLNKLFTAMFVNPESLTKNLQEVYDNLQAMLK